MVVLGGGCSPISWTFTQTTGGEPTVNTMSYDTADRLLIQNNNGKSGAPCTGRQSITTGWTDTGWEASRNISGADSACTYTPKQTTAWTYFDNGKLKSATITSFPNGVSTVRETHTVNYSPGGTYNNGNRTTDAFALNGPGSTVCTGTAPSCTATNTYDARDRLKSATDGHGGTTSYTFDENNENNSADTTIRAGNITTQATPQGTTTSTGFRGQDRQRGGRCSWRRGVWSRSLRADRPDRCWALRIWRRTPWNRCGSEVERSL